MHSYSIDNNERITVISFIGIASVYIFHFLQNYLVIYIPSIAVAISPFLIFSLIFAFYNFLLWKWIKCIPLIKKFRTVPDMNGVYRGILNSSYSDYKIDFPVEVKVEQTWTKILVTLQTKTSKSCSKSGSIMLHKNCYPVLLYSYQNDPNIDASETMQIHYGTCEHVWDFANNSFDAVYYAGRNRNTLGKISLKKI